MRVLEPLAIVAAHSVKHSSERVSQDSEPWADCWWVDLAHGVAPVMMGQAQQA